MRKYLLLIVLALFLPSLCAAQGEVETTQKLRDAAERLSPDSPFTHIATEAFKKAASPLPFVCPWFLYYQNGPNASYYFYTENVPTSEWAAKINKPISNPMAQACTVWTVNLDFELLNASLTQKDTIRIFVREVTPPYATIFNTWFIARVGQNQGSYEIDPPVVPPLNVRAVIKQPLRDVFIGYSIIGDSTHQVKWRFTTPSMYVTTPHSFKFVNRSTISTASQALGVSVDWVFETRMCCDIPIPVELSVFDAQVDDDMVHLHWRTETETNNFSFEVQRALSPDGPWESRGHIPGHGTSNLPQEYEYPDPITKTDFTGGAPPVYWYRLRQRDFDGTIYDYAPIQVHVADISATGFELMPAYPNPLQLSVSNRARIRYRVPEETNVRIAVYDMLGRELAMLRNSLHPAGVYEASWYPGPNAMYSGYYFIRMEAGDFHSTTKLSLVR